MSAASVVPEDKSGRLARALASGRRDGRPLLIPFVTFGYPALNATVPLVTAIAAAGADIIEIGVPFSDPLADGPTIQRASERALANGASLARTLDAVRALRAQPSTRELPLVLMGYCNPILRYGLSSFLDDAIAAGVDGLIVPDLPPEEASEYREGCLQRGLAAVFLVAPNAPDDRIRLVDELSTHFSYCVSVTGVTGARGDVHERTVDFLRRVRRLAQKPFVVGFGIKAPAHVRALGPHADGVVVGSALLEVIDGAWDRRPDAGREEANDFGACAAAAGEMIAALRDAAAELSGDVNTASSDQGQPAPPARTS